MHCPPLSVLHSMTVLQQASRVARDVLHSGDISCCAVANFHVSKLRASSLLAEEQSMDTTRRTACKQLHMTCFAVAALLICILEQCAGNQSCCRQ